MTSRSVENPRTDIWTLVVDAINDFGHEDGAFAQSFPGERSILDIMPKLQEMTEYYQGRCTNVLVRSAYEKNRFIADKADLTDLCIEGTWGRESVLPPALFQRMIDKTDNSLFSSEQIQSEPEPPKVIIATGVTLTSCLGISMRNAVDQTLNKTEIKTGGDAKKYFYPVSEGWHETQWILSKDTCAYRKERQADVDALFAELNEHPNVHVVDTYEEAIDLAEKLAA